MSMSVGPAEEGEDTPMSDINTTPLVDVMLVLLIIFLITVPVVIQTVPLSLPTVTNLPTTTKPENVLLSVDANCDTYWGQTKVELPEVHIRGDKDMEYRCVGGVIYTMQRAGFVKIGFISEPAAGNVTR